MNEDLKEFFIYMGLGMAWAAVILVAVALGAAALFLPLILAIALHQPWFYLLYIASPVIIGGFIGAYLWFEDNA